MTASMRDFPFGAALILAFLLTAGRADAQLGGLIKKKVTQATSTAQAGEPVKFDAVVLEITADRVNKLIAAKRAAKQMADGPGGPGAIRAKLEPVDARQVAIYEKQVDAINTWDEKRRDQERCFSEALSALQDQARSRQAMPDQQTLQKMMQLGQAMAAAQQRGDTAEMRRIAEALDRLKAPTRADSLAAEKQCGPPPAPPPLVKQWLDLKTQLDTLTQQLAASEDSIRATEARLSGMDARQSAMLCERIKQYIEQLKKKQQHVGFTATEQQTLANLSQALKDLDALCP